MMDTSTVLSTVRVRQSAARNLYYDSALPNSLVETLWQCPEKLVALGRLLREKAVRRTALVEWDEQRYVLKQYVEPTWWYAVKHSFSRSRAWRAWSGTHRLLAANVHTHYPVACIESPLGQLCRDSFFMYRYIEGETLDSFFKRRPDTNAAKSVLAKLHAIWRKLRSVQTSLTDTHVRNFIITRARQVSVIDIDDLRVHHSSLVTAHYQLRAWNRLLRSVPPTYSRAA